MTHCEVSPSLLGMQMDCDDHRFLIREDEGLDIDSDRFGTHSAWKPYRGNVVQLESFRENTL